MSEPEPGAHASGSVLSGHCRWVYTLHTLLAIGIPLALLLLAVLALERGGDRLPYWLQRLSDQSGLVWNIGLALIITLSVLRWLLRR